MTKYFTIIYMWTKSQIIVLPITLAIVIAITVGLFFALRNKSDKIKNIPLTVITVILLVLEVIKQTRAIILGYNFNLLPLQFCSLFLFFFPIAQFGKGKVRQFGQALSFLTSLAFVLVFLWFPTIIIGEACDNIFANFSRFHTFTFHWLVYLYFLIFVSQNVYKPQKKDLHYIGVGMSIFFVVCATFSNILKINFANMYSSYIPIVEKFRVACGQIPYLIGYYVVGISACIFATWLYSRIYYAIVNKKSNQKQETVLETPETEPEILQEIKK